MSATARRLTDLTQLLLVLGTKCPTTIPRSFLIYDGEPFGWGINHDLPELAEHLAYNGGGESEERNPRRTRVSIDQAREAAREFIKTGQRPTNVDWFEPTDDD